jgi:hypothetical protein
VVVLTETDAMARTLSEHVTDLPEGKAGSSAVTNRAIPPAPPPDDGASPSSAGPVHVGMWLALLVWLFGFLMLALQVLVETCIGLIHGVSH